jgi:hypothetical protein
MVLASKRRTLDVSEARRLLDQLQREGGLAKSISGAALPRGLAWKPSHVAGITLDSVDWPGALISGPLFRRATLRDCRFQLVNLDGLTIRKTDFVGCRFDATIFGERDLGLVEDCSFVDCTITAGRIDQVRFLGSTFRSCRFENVRARKSRWEKCILEDTVVTGSWVSVNLVGNTFRRVDLSGSELSDCAIVDSAEEDPRLPDRPTNFAIRPAVFTKAERELQEKLDRDGLLEQLDPPKRQVVMATLYSLRHSI